MLHHERDQPCMVIMHMDDIGLMLPAEDPVEYSDLESGEAFGIIIIAIYFFPVKQTIDINEVKIESQFIGRFFDDGEFKPPVSHIGITFMNTSQSFA